LARKFGLGLNLGQGKEGPGLEEGVNFKGRKGLGTRVAREN